MTIPDPKFSLGEKVKLTPYNDATGEIRFVKVIIGPEPRKVRIAYLVRLDAQSNERQVREMSQAHLVAIG